MEISKIRIWRDTNSYHHHLEPEMSMAKCKNLDLAKEGREK
jgi:hypothetical protein